MGDVRQFSFAAQSVTSNAFPLLGGAGSAGAPTYSFSADPTAGIYSFTTNFVAIATNGTGRIMVGDSGAYFRNDAALRWTSGTLNSADAQGFLPTASNVLTLQNAGIAQDLRVYGTTTGPKYGSLSHNGTVTVVTDSGGSGVRVGSTSGNVGFYGTAPVALQTGVALTVTALKTCLSNLGLCT